MNDEDVIEILKQGGVGVLATDTLYGLVGSALERATVERIYAIKRRDGTKPLIVRVPSIDSIETFGVVLSDSLRERLSEYWPGAYTIVLPTIDQEFEFLTRGKDTIALRVPNDERLREILLETGPLVAPSANPEGESPAATIEEALRYFGDSVDFYQDGGEPSGKASTIIALDESGDETVIRE